MNWVLIGIFVADMTFYFKILEIHSSHIKCLYAGEAHIQKIDRPRINFATACVPTDQIEGSVL